MLWYKGWLETQFRLLLALGMLGCLLIFLFSLRPTAPAAPLIQAPQPI
jgi:hypothetical protein